MKIYALYFSPTGGTKKVLDIISEGWQCERIEIDLANQEASLSRFDFEPNDVCFVAVPSFSGRVPQFLVPRLKEMRGNGTKAILITAYGNRAYDDTLIELKDVMESAGFSSVCAIAAVTEHSIMPRYGKGRPDADDIVELQGYAAKCKEIVESGSVLANVPGNVPYRPYLSVPLKPKANR